MNESGLTAMLLIVLLYSCVSTPSNLRIRDDNTINFYTNPQLTISISKDFHYTHLRTADTLDFLFTSPEAIQFYQLSKSQPLFLDHRYRGDFATTILVDVRPRNLRYPQGQGLKEYF